MFFSGSKSVKIKAGCYLNASVFSNHTEIVGMQAAYVTLWGCSSYTDTSTCPFLTGGQVNSLLLPHRHMMAACLIIEQSCCIQCVTSSHLTAFGLLAVSLLRWSILFAILGVFLRSVWCGGLCFTNLDFYYSHARLYDPYSPVIC